MKIINILLVILLASCLQLSCSKKSVEPANQPPSVPEIDAASGTPGTHAIDQPVTLILHWKCTDPDQDSLSYDLFFGISPEPDLLAEGLIQPNYALPTLAYSTEYYWQIVARDGRGGESSSDIWTFQTQARPNLAPVLGGFSPQHRTTYYPVVAELAWSCSDPDGDTLRYDIFLGTDAESLDLVEADYSDTSYQSDSLEYSRRYYWSILAKDGRGGEDQTAARWFETEPSPNAEPILGEFLPPDQAVDLPPIQMLSWTLLHPKDGSFTYDVYLGFSGDPPLVASGLSTASYGTGNIWPDMGYHWKVVATDTAGNFASSPVMTFTTRHADIAPLVVGNKWRYDVTIGTLTESWRLEILGSYMVPWEEELYTVFHWHWKNETQQSSDAYYWLMRNEVDGLWTMGYGNLAGDSAWVYRQMVIKYPVNVGDSWKYGEPNSGYYENWVCMSTNDVRTTSAGTFTSIKYAVRYNGSPSDTSSPLGPLLARREKNRQLGGTTNGESSTALIFYVPELGLLGMKDGEYLEWLTNYELK